MEIKRQYFAKNKWSSVKYKLQFLKLFLLIAFGISFLLAVSCATIPDITKRSVYLPTSYDANSEAAQKLLAYAPSIDISRLSSDIKISQILNTGTMYGYLVIVDTSAIPVNDPYFSLFKPYDFSTSFFQKPKNGEIILTIREYSYLNQIFYIDPSSDKWSVTNIDYEGDDKAIFIKLCAQALQGSTPISMTTLSGTSKVAFGLNIFKLSESQKRTPVWEGISIDPPLYAAAYQWHGGSQLPFNIPSRPPVVVRGYSIVIACAKKPETIASIIKPERLYPDGYSIVDNRDKDGFDRDGYNRDGYDRLGWSDRRRIAAKVQVFDESPAALSGIKNGDLLLSMDKDIFTPSRDVKSIVAMHKPGDKVSITIKSNDSGERNVDVVMGSSPIDISACYLGIAYKNESWGATDSKNAKGERWSGSISNGRQGLGVFTKLNGDKYIGTFYNDAAMGSGLLIPTAGDPEVQIWNNGTFIASHKVTGAALSSRYLWIYLGMGSTNGLAQGRGDAVSADGQFKIENGNFDKGHLIEGTIIGPDGTRYQGSFSKDILARGIIMAADGRKYEGELKEGLPYGKGTMLIADGTKYNGDFKGGTYNGEGVITRPNGEKYEGTFKDGKPNGMGIYSNGEVVERCEYYDGKRIDQAYQIRQENEKQLEALRIERERIAKEKADAAEQERIANERQAAEVAAANQKSSNNLLGSLLVGGFAAGLSGAVGLDAGTALSLGASAAADTYKGDTGMSTMKSTGQAIVDSKSANDANGGRAGSSGSKMVNRSSVSQAFLSQRPNRLLEAKFKGWEGHKDNDYQYYSFCATADMYYKEFFSAAQQGKSEQECAQIYQQHLTAVSIAEQMMATWDSSPTLKTAPSPKSGTKEAEGGGTGPSNPGAVQGNM